MKKIVQATTVAALTIASLTMTGCGDDTTSTTTPTAATLSIYTADYSWNTNSTLQGAGSVLADDDTTLTGATEANIWKGKAGVNDALTLDDEVYTHTVQAVRTTDITVNTTFTAGNAYPISGAINVTNGAILTIQAGALVYGETAATYLAVNNDGSIIADGTQAAPIIFTSKSDFEGTSTVDAKGEWGGLVILGNAYTHAGVKTYEAGTQSYGAIDHTNDTESSGTLNFVVIKHSGYEVEVDKELNGLSLAGVGSGTTVTNIAIIGGFDDGIEMWGGTVDVTGLYVYNASDDSVDVDLGYRGTITDVLVQQGTVDKTTFDSSTIEAGNDSNTYDVDATTATLPTIVNGTFYGVGGSIYLKNDAGISLSNVKLQLNNAATTTQEMIKHRTADVFDTNALFVEAGNLSLKNLQDATALYAVENAKD